MAAQGSQPHQRRAPKSDPISQDRWAEVQDEFHDLFIDQNWPLRRVRTHMKEKRGFSPSERQYKAQMKIWKYKKYNKVSKKPHLSPDDATRSDGPPSTISSEIDPEDNNALIGTSDDCVTNADESGQSASAVQENLAMNGAVFTQNISSFRQPEALQFATEGISSNSENWPRGISHNIPLRVMPQSAPQSHWPCGIPEDDVGPQFPAHGAILAGSYDELEAMGAVNNSGAPSTSRGSFNRRGQIHRGNEESPRTIGSTLQSFGDYLNEYDIPSSF